MENSEIVRESKSILRGNYGKVIFPFLIVFIVNNLLTRTPLYQSLFNISEIESGIITFSITVLITFPLLVGLASYSISITNELFDSNKLFDGFKIFVKSVFAGLIYNLLIILGLVLLIVPGFYAALTFSQVFYVISQNNDIGIKEAFKQSSALMKGHKWQLFKLGIRYLFYLILSVFTLYIWALWLIPQMNVSYAIFYRELNKKFSDLR